MEENMIFRGIFQNEIDKKIQKYLVKKYKFNLTIKYHLVIIDLGNIRREYLWNLRRFQKR